MLKAFNNDFINEMKDKYNDFKDKTNAQIFYDWVNSFKYEFGNLFPEPESITIDNNTKKLDNLLKLKELGANIADIEAELNEDEIFKNEMDLDGEAPTFTEGEQSLDDDDNLDADNNLDNTVDNGIHHNGIIDNKIDYNMWRFVEADAKKDFNENDVKRDKDGKFAEKNETGDADNDNKDNDTKDNSKDNDKQKDNKDNLNITALQDLGLNPRQISRFTIELEDLGIIEYDDKNDSYKIKSSLSEAIENNETLKNILGDKADIIKEQLKENNDKDEPQTKNNKNKTVKECINSVSKHLQPTAKKLYQPHDKQKSLILKDNIDYNKDNLMENIEQYIDEDKVKKLSELEDIIMSFTDQPNTRDSSYWSAIEKDLKELIEKSPSLKSIPYRLEWAIKGRDNFEIGTEVNFDIRSFSDFESGLETALKSTKLFEKYSEGSEVVIYKIEDEDINGLDISSLSVYPNQKECLINGTFIISNVEESKEFGHKVITLKKPKNNI